MSDNQIARLRAAGNFLIALAIPVATGLVWSGLLFGKEAKLRGEHHGMQLFLFDLKVRLLGKPDEGYSELLFRIGTWFAGASFFSNLIRPSFWIFLTGPFIYCAIAASNPGHGDQGLAWIIVLPLLAVSIPSAALGAALGAATRAAYSRRKSVSRNT